MNIEKTLKEVYKEISEERELLPNVDNMTDNQIRKKLKVLFLLKDPDAEKVLKRVNLVRRSEGLDNLTKNEILSKTLKKDIVSKSKEKQKKEKPKKEFKPIEKKGLKITHRWGFGGTSSDFSKTSVGIKKDLNDNTLFNKLVDLNNQVDSIRKVIICEYNGNKFLVAIVSVPNNESYELRVLGFNGTVKLAKKEGVGLEARFPEINKKIIARPNAEIGEWKVKKL